MSIHESKHRRWRVVAAVVAGVFAFYVVTVGLAPAISGHIELGRLAWLDSEATFSALDAYMMPATYLARVPGFGSLLQLSESFWRQVTGAPICVYYGMRLEQVQIGDAPKELMETFQRECPNSEVVSIGKEFGGRNHKRFIFWVIRFRQDGQLREALMDSPKKVEMTYDVKEE